VTEHFTPALTRRAVLVGGGGIALSGLLAACVPTRTSPTATPNASDGKVQQIMFTDSMLASFDGAVSQAFTTFGLVGASVALFQGRKIVYNKAFGVRDVDSGLAATTETKFRIGSNTKSMTSLLIAKYVDQGLTTWDTKVIDLWPKFTAPTAALTRSLTLHQLLGMGSGIAEPETIEFFAADGETDAHALLETIPSLEVIARDNEKYYYNNTLVAAAPYLVMLKDGTAPAQLAQRYADDVASLVFDPIGMEDSVVAADPRPFGPDYATGYQRDLAQNLVPVPFVSIGGYAPAGSVLSSSTDMARYLITQFQLGTSPDGKKVASAASVGRTHEPGVIVPPDSQNGLPSVLLGDTKQTNYDLGWFDEEFNDGQRMLWHAGGIDGFGSLMGFLPEHGVGFVSLTNFEPSVGGLFNFSIQSSFLNEIFGLNAKLPALLATVPATNAEKQRQALAGTKPVDAATVAPYLGLYSEGFLLALSGEDLELTHDVRTVHMRAVDAGGYLIIDGPSILFNKSVTLADDGKAGRTMTIDGFEPVEWLTGS
jgi:CubicO group peptidase (beta-lactamase class C family)